jgi:NAD(P)-dependent dehydrogenase (short-subunit alcohol dehydrogenase family)
MQLRDRIAIVTGGLSGIGAGIIARFAAEGATAIAADIAATDDDPVNLRVDVTDPDSVRRMVDAVLARYGRIDCLVHGAGIGKEAPFLETPLADFDRVHAVNLRGTFIIGQAVAAAMVAAGGGAIVNIASVAGLRGSILRAAYGSSKAGVIVLSQVMATELASHGVRVNVLAPGPVETPMVTAMHGAATRAAWTRRIPMGRYAAVDEVTGAALFLCSDAARFVTGTVLTVDGGFAGSGLTA